jgi:hypothetical protein
VSLGFKPRAIIADIVAPRVKVPKQSDKYRIFGKNTWITHESRWAPGTIPNAIEIRWSEDTYYAELRKLRTLVLDTERRNSDDDGSRLEQQTTERSPWRSRSAREKRVADLFTTAGNYSVRRRRSPRRADPNGIRRRRRHRTAADRHAWRSCKSSRSTRWCPRLRSPS